MYNYQLQKTFVGICLMATSILASGNELTFAGRSAQEAFQNDGVINLLRAVIKKDVNEEAIQTCFMELKPH